MSTGTESTPSDGTRTERARTDPLSKKAEPPDRVFYATGVLLDAEDFQAEQTYHRGRLARAMSYAHGSGTVAGLGVAWEEARDRVVVEPGMAIDRVGRIIEVPRRACIRLKPWYDWYKANRSSKLTDSYRTSVKIRSDVLAQVGGQWIIEAGPEDESVTGVVVDVFVQFVSCERGKTPAFATGPFDATDAAQPSRLRDGYEVTLVPRVVTNPDLPVPAPAWPSLQGVADPVTRRHQLEDLILGRWRERSADWTDDGPVGGPEHLPNQDTTSLFLARMVLPATMPDDSSVPVRTTEAVRVDNHLRSFVYTAGALAAVLPWGTTPVVDERAVTTPSATTTTSTTSTTSTSTTTTPGTNG